MQWLGGGSAVQFCIDSSAAPFGHVLRAVATCHMSVIQVHYNTDLTHGEFLIKSEVKQAIMGELRAMLARSGNAVVGLARPVLKTTITLVHNAIGATKVRLHTTKAGNR